MSDLDKEAQEKIDRVIVKVWDMAKGDINNEPCVRKATLEWAREELGWKPPKENLYEQFPVKKKYRVAPPSEPYKPSSSPVGFVDE